MELEFDKEMDAILRKAGNSGPKSDAVSPHVDADTIAAFADDALPQKAKLLYMQHFADCDKCRQMLGQTILFNSEPSETAALSRIAAPVLEPRAPWYQTLVRSPNLALTTGALVLVFGGILGFLLLQNRESDTRSTVSQITDAGQTKGGPFFDHETAESNAATESPSLQAANQATDSPAAASALNANKSAATAISPTNSNALAKAVADDCPNCKPADTDKVETKENRLVTELPLSSRSAESIAAKREEKNITSDGIEADRTRSVSSNRSAAESGLRNVPASPKAKMNPARGPVQTQSNQVNTNVFDMAVSRKSGGKTFVNRDGAWYDTAYKNQPTKNYRRGTDEYKKLDSGLRKIVDEIGGTVVLVWKEKAYRIQ
ncbi:MAG: hypothetical protein ABIV48_00355 [Pyrinomonadaceae bacterium]